MAEPKITRLAAHISAGSNLPVNRIVIHTTESAKTFPQGSALGLLGNVSKYFASPSSGGSAHYIEGVEGEEHCVPDNRPAWHAPPNSHSIGIELVALAKYTREQWLSDQVRPIIVRAAARTRELCQRFNVPMVRLTVAQVKAGKRGICGHVDVSNAFKHSDHWDPGPNFPWDVFMSLVTAGATPAPTPPAAGHKPGARTVGLGDDGADVAYLQRIIGTPADGDFGPATVTALKVWQKKNRLTADGICGAQTWAAVLAPAKPSKAPQRPAVGRHRVAKGETAYGIATKRKVSLKALAAANAGVVLTALSVGQVLNVPTGAPTPAPTPTVKVSTPAPTRVPTPPKVGTPSPTRVPTPAPTGTKAPLTKSPTVAYYVVKCDNRLVLVTKPEC